MTGGRCACAHSAELHDDDGAGRCTVTLPPFEEEEMPAWSCRCRQFTAATRPDGPWRWHAPTESWQGVAAAS